MSRDLTDAEQEYLILDSDCLELRKFIGDRRSGAVETGFSAETREACARDVSKAEKELAEKEKRMGVLKLQFKVDQAARHARDLAAARRRRDKDLGGG